MRSGETVVQVYIHDEEASVEVPKRQLVFFKRVMLESGEEKSVPMLHQGQRSGSHTEKWNVCAGARGI
ncbi:fibronectin type III-like domain-contianing protein [Blautia sp. RD014234]|nr:fibronectin type III-like domain-contianing protein [Blautia parvula]